MTIEDVDFHPVGWVAEGWLFATKADAAAYDEVMRAGREAAERPPASYVYFMQAGTRGPIKIGVAVDPWKRRTELQVGSAQRIQILATIPGNAEVERELHARFAELRLDGEWFAPKAPLRQFIREAGSPRRRRPKAPEAKPAGAAAVLRKTHPACGHSWDLGTLPMRYREYDRAIRLPCPNCGVHDYECKVSRHSRSAVPSPFAGERG